MSYGAPPPGYPPMQPNTGYLPPKPNNYLVWSIVCTIVCCLPLGIVAIIQSTKVDSLYAAGQYEASVAAAAKAKKWIIWGAVLGAVFAILYLVLVFGLGILGTANSNY